MESVLQDIRYGFRALLRNPGVTAVAVIVLALGTGANTAIFTAVNAVLLRPLPYPDSDRLVMLWETNPRFQIGVDTLPVTAGNFMDWRDQNGVFEYVSAFGAGRLNLTGAGEPERIGGAGVSPNFFALLGIEPRLGHWFREDDERAGSDKVVVISYALWQRRFAGDIDIVGKTITLDSASHTIVGVAPEGFQFPGANEMPYFVGAGTQTELWKPMTLTDEFVNRKRANHQLCVIARLKPRVSLEQSQSEMNALAQRLEETYVENRGIGVKVVPLTEQIVGNVRLALLVLMGAVALVLLIACANVANLMLAQSSARQREIAIRAALGASRSRIVRQLLTEALLLSFTGAIAGVLLSVWGVKMLSALIPKNLPRSSEFSVDLNVLGFTIALAVVTSLLFGSAPAFHASTVNLTVAIKDGARGLMGGFHHNRVRSLLVMSEVALSMILLIGAGLMLKSLARLLGTDPGFKPDNTLTMQIALLGSKYPNANKQVAFFEELTRRVESMPGVQSGGVISSAPLSGGVYAGGFSIEGRAAPSEGNDFVADRRMISEEYLNTIGIPLIAGRHFTDRDDQTSPGVVIVSDSFARRFFPNEDPVGRRIKLGGRDSTRPWLSIVGIAGDVKDTALEKDVRPCVYIPYPQFPATGMTLVVRAAVNPRSLVAGIRDEVWEIDKDQPVTNVKTMGEYVADSLSPRVFNASLFTVFASLAVVLAAVGIYGVTVYSVSQRIHEIGIRVALGAQSSDVMKLVVGRVMAIVLAGVVIGVAGALGLTRVMSSLLYGVSATDPMTFAGVSILVIGVALLASYIPSRRATKIDPMAALRCQ